jgi:hypothetical protein
MNKLASLTIAAAGAIHLILAPQHYAHAPAHGIFFAIVGLAELAWALAFLRYPTQPMYYAGLALAGGLVVLWVITRYLPAPFEHEMGVIDLGGIVCKFSEMVGIVALVGIALQGRIAGLARHSLARLAGTALLLALSVGAVTYSVASWAEPLFPSLAGKGYHEGEEHHEELEQHDHE